MQEREYLKVFISWDGALANVSTVMDVAFRSFVSCFSPPPFRRLHFQYLFSTGSMQNKSLLKTLDTLNKYPDCILEYFDCGKTFILCL